ncbi:hypothetical protein, partial [Klebsiella pneumoniae]|uniref:hypothetical protein n=1 Tax=Klebsiella pneumoniae TaxID=573 RepID=UPI001F4A6E01
MSHTLLLSERTLNSGLKNAFLWAPRKTSIYEKQPWWNQWVAAVPYNHFRAPETRADLDCRLLL